MSNLQNMNYMGSTDNAFVIKQPDFDNLVLELNDLVDKIEMILRDVEMKVYNSQEYFKGDVADELRLKFKTYSKQIDVMSNNLLTYSNDLLKLKQSLKDNDKNILNSLNDFAAGLKTQAEKINEQ